MMIHTTLTTNNEPHQKLTLAALINHSFLTLLAHNFLCPSSPLSQPKTPFGAEFWVSTRRCLPPARSRTGVHRVRGGELNNIVITQKSLQKQKTQKSAYFHIKNMQNKPNLNKWIFTPTSFNADTYVKLAHFYVKKTNPIQTQFKPKKTYVILVPAATTPNFVLSAWRR